MFTSHGILRLATHYSWWPKSVRVTAYVHRFVDRCRKKTSLNSSDGIFSRSITAEEYNKSRIFWLRQIQAECFANELILLKQGRVLPTKSSLLPFTPFLDSDGLIRVGGRIKHSTLSTNSKHPILLTSHPLTMKIIYYTHMISL